MDHPLLTVKNLSIDFISNGFVTTAVSNISFSVAKGELLAIVGESGSGKSVTALSILQLLPTPPAKYTSGKIVLTQKGQPTNLLACHGNQLRAIRGNKVAMIFQEPMSSLNPVLSCGSQVAEALRAHQTISPEKAKQQTIQLFTRVELPDAEGMYHRYPHELSGGQKQRVMIAMAICCKPALLICDEPTTALDVTVQKNILLLIKQLQHQYQMGVIFITHDLNLVAEIADKVAVMYKGKLVELNTAQHVFTQPQHPYTKALLACRPALYTSRQRLPVVSDFMQATYNAIPIKIMENAGSHLLNNPTLATEKSADVVANNGILPQKILYMITDLQVIFAVKKRFFGKATNHIKAVNEVSFDIREGETLGLVGESGCGKSTLGRALLHLIKPTAGKLIFDGLDLAMATATEWKQLRTKMQIIFQDPFSSLNPRLSIGAAIAEPLAMVNSKLSNGELRQRVCDLLEKVGLSAGHYQRYPHEFSGGQRQRIVIARALILNPSFIICDESVSALDVSVQAQVLNLINELKRDFGFTALFISHDLAVVRYISDRIMVMHMGKIIESGAAETIYHHPQSPYTKKLIEAIPSGKVSLPLP